jgi:hypothetical protein
MIPAMSAFVSHFIGAWVVIFVALMFAHFFNVTIARIEAQILSMQNADLEGDR